eukprot:364187-Chlamydomonas_euryale.AAC.3
MGDQRGTTHACGSDICIHAPEVPGHAASLWCLCVRTACSTQKARRDFSRVLELKPEHKSAASELALTEQVEGLLAGVRARFEAGGSLDGIGDQLQQVFDLAQDCTEAQLLDARLALANEDWDQVIALTGRLLKGEPSSLPALVMRGKGYFYAGDDDLAKRHFGEALKYDPDYQDAREAFNKVRAAVVGLRARGCAMRWERLKTHPGYQDAQSVE